MSENRKRYWRSLEELADTDEFRAYLGREFPEQASQWNNTTSRRQFLQLMGASLALAGVSGCRIQPEEKIVPYVKQPEQIVPGRPLYFATAMTLGGAATGLLVESHMGRPTKVEGNPKHPASPATLPSTVAEKLDADFQLTLPAASDAFAQASVLELYDPDRSQTVQFGRQISTWNAFLTNLKPRLDAVRKNNGRGLRILTETVISPTLGSQFSALLTELPEAKWHQYEPVNRDNMREGALLAFGEDVNVKTDFSKADVVLSLDADFLSSGPGHLRHARDFMNRRNVLRGEIKQAEMNRLYAVECTPTVTGMAADHRLSLPPKKIAVFARAIAHRLGVPVSQPSATELDGVPADWLDAVADDLQNYRLKRDPGASLVVAGPWQPRAVHALVHAINEKLGSVDKTVVYTEPLETNPVNQTESLSDLVEDMQAGHVEMLLILGGNPVFTAPADVKFATALQKVPFRVHLGLYDDETSEACRTIMAKGQQGWHVPQSHFLESWSDTRAYDGQVSIVQPMIAPLYAGRSAHEMLSLLLNTSGKSPYDTVRDYWKAQRGSEGFDDWWETALHEGVISETKYSKKAVQVKSDLAANIPAAGAAAEGIQIVFRPDPTIYDGRFANSGWLQELPKPLTKLTWDNAALLSPATATELGAKNGDMIGLERGGRSVSLPVWVLPGQPDNTITVQLGYGRRRAGRVGTKAGFDVYPFRISQSPWFLDGVTAKLAGDPAYQLASTDNNYLIALHDHLAKHREIIRSGTIHELIAHPGHPDFMHAHHGPTPDVSFYDADEFPYEGHKWGMSVNLGACIGCNGCVVACQAENNIPVVGKQEVLTGRQMHWLRIDRYFAGEEEDPEAYFQPVMCVHCELAPCEPVCPVAATTHSDEGLNEMTYNRCVGTRYCANNCPYKVRRFNFLHYTKPVDDFGSLKLLQNPDVTVRARGVMEKCTYCVQRISAARIAAEKSDRPDRRVDDGEVITACQAACPTNAIVFGDLNDPDSQVAKLKNKKQNPLDYALLGELNTRPRTTYSASVKNPNKNLMTPHAS